MDPISNYKFINDKINSLAKKVTLIVVSKTFTMNIIKPLIDFGHLHFGENKVQEASLKWTDTLLENKNLKLHVLLEFWGRNALQISSHFAIHLPSMRWRWI